MGKRLNKGLFQKHGTKTDVKGPFRTAFAGTKKEPEKPINTAFPVAPAK